MPGDEPWYWSQPHPQPGVYTGIYTAAQVYAIRSIWAVLRLVCLARE